MWIRYCSSVILLFLTISLNSQCLYNKATLEEVAAQSDIIVDGKIVSVECRWNQNHSMIYTRYGIKVYSLFKGSVTDTVFFYSAGGTVDLRKIKVEPSVHPPLDSYGLFMLSSAPLTADLPAKALIASQGHLSWYSYNYHNGMASSVFETYPLVEKKLDRAIVEITGIKPIRKHSLPVVNTYHTNNSRAITGFSPASITAGTTSVLTINGSGFGSVADTVFFLWASNPNFLAFALPGQVVSWSPTQIKVHVPDDAGTGPVYVSTSTSAGPNQNSATNVNIISAQTNVVYNNAAYITRHSTQTNVGKISFQLNTAFNNNNDARLSFARAMKTWRCNNNFNIDINPVTTSVNAIADDNVNVVRFSNLTNPLGVTYTYFQGCTIGSVLYWHTTEIDMEFDDTFSNASWNFGPANPAFNQYDFESVVLHELGHALLLSHVIDENKIMHRFINNGAVKRNPSADEIAAVAAVNIRSTTNTFMCGFFPLTQAGNIMVSGTGDSGTGTLRQAVNDVCNNDTIQFSIPTASTITLTIGEIAIGSDMKIFGNDINNSIISGNNSGRIFNVAAGKSLTLRDMKLINGNAASNGGAIYNQGTLFLKNVQFQNNGQGSTLKKAFSTAVGAFVNLEGNIQFKI